MHVSQQPITDRNTDERLTLYWTKATGIPLLSKRTFDQHWPTWPKILSSSATSSSLLRVRSRLVMKLANVDMHLHDQLTLPRTRTPQARRTPVHSLQSPESCALWRQGQCRVSLERCSLLRQSSRQGCCEHHQCCKRPRRWATTGQQSGSLKDPKRAARMSPLERELTKVSMVQDQ